MDNVMTKGFVELSATEMEEIDGGILDFLGDIYDSWNNMWKDFGRSVYYLFH